MTNELPPGGIGAGNEDDLGQPVGELMDLALPLGVNFPDKVRRRIERRLLTAELIDLAWTAPLAVLVELLRAPFEALAARRRS